MMRDIHVEETGIVEYAAPRLHTHSHHAQLAYECVPPCWWIIPLPLLQIQQTEIRVAENKAQQLAQTNQALMSTIRLAQSQIEQLQTRLTYEEESRQADTNAGCPSTGRTVMSTCSTEDAQSEQGQRSHDQPGVLTPTVVTQLTELIPALTRMLEEESKSKEAAAAAATAEGREQLQMKVQPTIRPVW